MKLLLDTRAFLWWVFEDDRLSRRARQAMADERNEVFFSVVSALEIVMKAGLGKLTLKEAPDRFVPRQLEVNPFELLPLHLRHALKVATLPHLHRDPFDRLLVAQALVEQISIVSGDEQVRRYPAKVVW